MADVTFYDHSSNSISNLSGNQKEYNVSGSVSSLSQNLKGEKWTGTNKKMYNDIEALVLASGCYVMLFSSDDFYNSDFFAKISSSSSDLSNVYAIRPENGQKNLKNMSNTAGSFKLYNYKPIWFNLDAPLDGENLKKGFWAKLFSDSVFNANVGPGSSGLYGQPIVINNLIGFANPFPTQTDGTYIEIESTSYLNYVIYNVGSNFLLNSIITGPNTWLLLFTESDFGGTAYQVAPNSNIYYSQVLPPIRSIQMWNEVPTSWNYDTSNNTIQNELAPIKKHYTTYKTATKMTGICLDVIKLVPGVGGVVGNTLQLYYDLFWPSENLLSLAVWDDLKSYGIDFVSKRYNEAKLNHMYNDLGQYGTYLNDIVNYVPDATYDGWNNLENLRTLLDSDESDFLGNKTSVSGTNGVSVDYADPQLQLIFQTAFTTLSLIVYYLRTNPDAYEELTGPGNTLPQSDQDSYTTDLNTKYNNYSAAIQKSKTNMMSWRLGSDNIQVVNDASTSYNDVIYDKYTGFYYWFHSIDQVQGYIQQTYQQELDLYTLPSVYYPCFIGQSMTFIEMPYNLKFGYTTNVLTVHSVKGKNITNITLYSTNYGVGMRFDFDDNTNLSFGVNNTNNYQTSINVQDDEIMCFYGSSGLYDCINSFRIQTKAGNEVGIGGSTGDIGSLSGDPFYLTIPINANYYLDSIAAEEMTLDGGVNAIKAIQFNYKIVLPPPPSGDIGDGDDSGQS